MNLKPTFAQIASVNFRQHPRYRGCIGHWMMIEGGGDSVYDLSGYGNTGTLTLGPTWVDGQFGRTLNFDGTNDQVSLGTSSVLKPPLPISVSAWYVYVSGSPNAIFTNDKTSATHSGIWMSRNEINFGDSGGNLAGNRRSFTLTTPPSSNVWHHIVGICRGATDMEIWVDGVQPAGSYSGTGGALTYLGTSGFIGRHATNAFHGGQIDDVRIYNRSLTPREVLSLYQEPFLEFEEDELFMRSIPQVLVPQSLVGPLPLYFVY